MKKQKGFMITELLALIFTIVVIIGWSMNIYKLTQCDFEAPYKAEVIRTIGIVPPIGAIVGWMNVGK